MLKALSFRYNGEIVYSYTGDVAISVNPFKAVGCVGAQILRKFKGAERRNLPPHIYPLIYTAYEGLKTNPDIHQSVIISGESGAGKTEAMKICLSCMVSLGSAGGASLSSTGEPSIAHKLMQTNPVR
jgi:myosin-1